MMSYPQGFLLSQHALVPVLIFSNPLVFPPLVPPLLSPRKTPSSAQVTRELPSLVPFTELLDNKGTSVEFAIRHFCLSVLELAWDNLTSRAEITELILLRAGGLQTSTDPSVACKWCLKRDRTQSLSDHHSSEETPLCSSSSYLRRDSETLDYHLGEETLRIGPEAFSLPQQLFFWPD